jgi:hypothetical protein
MSAAQTELRAAVRAALTAEFTAEGLVVDDDKLSGAVATDRHRGGCYPVSEQDGKNTIDTNNECRVQLYCQWDKQIDPEQAVSPAVIEGFVDRAKRALRTVRFPASEKTWFFSVPRVDYLPDPTGNITRAELVVRSTGENVALLETTA